MNNKTELHSIDDIISLIERLNINDLNIINEICTNCLGVSFLPVKNGEKKEYYIERLEIYKKRMDEGLELPLFLNAEVPFCVNYYYKGKC